MFKSTLHIATTVLLLGLWSANANAFSNAKTDSTDSRKAEHYKVDFGGYVKMWWSLYDEVTNGLRHPITLEEAPDEASGFSIYRARLRATVEKGRVTGTVSVRLDGSPPALLDAYFSVPVLARHLGLWAGQMKIPSTYEVLVSGAKWDFLTRSRFSENVVDFSLSRGPIASAYQFFGAKAYQRDLGFALKGKISSKGLSGDYFLMIGNGLGANRFIGGKEKKQEIFANSLGDYLYAARVTFGTDEQSPGKNERRKPIQARAGGHVSWNHHPNVLLDDERSVMNIKRRSWSVDAHTSIYNLLKLTGMYGEVIVDDDFDDDGKIDYKFDGWELKAIATLKPNLLDVGFRYDVFTDEYYENGAENTYRAYTFGIDYSAPHNIRLQLDYKFKQFESDVDLDLDENVLVLAAQLEI